MRQRERERESGSRRDGGFGRLGRGKEEKVVMGGGRQRGVATQRFAA